MGEPKSRSSVALGNKIQESIAAVMQEHNEMQGKISSALIVLVNQDEEVEEISVVSEEDLTTFALMYEHKLKK